MLESSKGAVLESSKGASRGSACDGDDIVIVISL